MLQLMKGWAEMCDVRVSFQSESLLSTYRTFVTPIFALFSWFLEYHHWHPISLASVMFQPPRVPSTGCTNAGRFGWGGDDIRGWYDSVSGDALGMSPDLCGKAHRVQGKFLEYHYGGSFFLLSFSRVGNWGWSGEFSIRPKQLESLPKYIMATDSFPHSSPSHAHLNIQHRMLMKTP